MDRLLLWSAALIVAGAALRGGRWRVVGAVGGIVLPALAGWCERRAWARLRAELRRRHPELPAS